MNKCINIENNSEKEKKDTKKRFNTVDPKRRKKALKTLEEIFERPDKILVIHYSCESFCKEEVSSPRITAISVRNLESGQTISFTIYKEAEIKKICCDEIDNHYDELELIMLNKFSDFISQKTDCKWLHWNMRDENYGFQAIAHRHTILGGSPAIVNDEMKIDLARLLISLYGICYIGHPRLEKIIKRNHITDQNFLNGEQEANAFDNKDFLALQRSTLRKVDCMCNIIERVNNSSLQTNATWWQIHGGSLTNILEQIKKHWIISLIIIISIILGLIIKIFQLDSIFHKKIAFYNKIHIEYALKNTDSERISCSFAGEDSVKNAC